jgi:uncharacterized protein (TIGR03437 family)
VRLTAVARISPGQAIRGSGRHGLREVNNQSPTNLDGVSVTVNGTLAYVYYISLTQINVLTPPGALSGSVSVVVTNGMPSAAFTVPAQAESPSFFVFNAGRYGVEIETGEQQSITIKRGLLTVVDQYITLTQSGITINAGVAGTLTLAAGLSQITIGPAGITIHRLHRPCAPFARSRLVGLPLLAAHLWRQAGALGKKGVPDHGAMGASA